jgi:ligand-binding sensor domain-containing protein
MRFFAYLRWLTVFFWCGFGRLAAQPRNLPLEFQHIQEFNGLSSNIVNTILQDRDGYLWIGTYGGLNRFDGSHFTVLKADRRSPNSLGNNIVHDLCQDKEGNLWLSTDDGISRYNSHTGQFLNIRSAIGKTFGQCMDILCDRNGRIWFSSFGNGLFRMEPKSGQFTHFGHDSTRSASLSSDYITKNGLLEDPRGNGLWITTDADGLNYLDLASGRFLNYRNNPENLPVYRKHETSALALDGKNRLVFADNTDERIVLYDLARKTVTDAITLKSQRDRSVFPMATIFVDRNHNLWASSWRYTMFYIQPGRSQIREFFHDLAEKSSIISDFFWAGWQQKDGTIWFGTVNGLSYTNPGKTFYQIHNLARSHPALLNGRGLTSFLEDDNGSWWLASSENELFHYEPASGQLQTYPIPARQLFAFRFGLPLLTKGFHPDELYICRARAVVIFNKRTRKFTPFLLPPLVFSHADYLKTMVRQGDWLWLFGFSDVVFRCHLPSGNWNTYAMPFNAGNTRFRVFSAGFDRTGRLWAEVENKGFIRFSAKEQQFVAYPNQQSTTGFTDHFAFHADAQNRIWTPVSGHGLVEFNPRGGSYRTWNEQDGLCSNECKAAIADSYGQIWMASYNKFSIIDPARSSVQNITLVINESNINYVNYMFPLRNGNILTTLKNYVIEFMPRRINHQSVPAKVLISTLSLPDTSIIVHASSPAIRLEVNENNFSINYAILNRAQQTYTYYYTLEGYDDHWVKADARTFANYTKIPGGDYTFRVKAVVGKIETGETKLAIHVDTAFYNTRWFRALLLALVLFLGYWLYQYRIQQKDRLHHFQIQMTRLERDKSEIQYQNLINHLNPHFLFNSLTSLNSLIKTKPKEASVFLRKLSIIYRYILQNKDKELVSLQDELAFAQNYIDLQVSRFGDMLQIGINVAPECLNRQIVPVTIQNLLENAIKHNIISDESPLQIRIYTENEALYVTNILQKKEFVETSNKQGLASLKSLYHYLSRQEVSVIETATHFTVAIPLL